MSGSRRQDAEIRWATLGEIASEGPTNGYSGPTGPDANGSPTLKLSATSQGRCVLDAMTTKRLYEIIPPDSDLWLEPGDLLVQRSNTIDLVGTAAIFDGPPRSFVYPDLLMRLRVRDPATARFVCRYLNSPGGRRAITRVAAGSAGSMPKISGAKLRALPVPLPSAEYQRRVAEVLDRADALRAKRRAALAQFETLMQAIFIELFGAPGVNPRGWPCRPIKELGRVMTGATPRSSTPGAYGGDVPFVTPGDLEGVGVKRFLTDAGAAACGTVRAGATLVCCIGSIGKTDIARVRSAFNQQINAIEWGSEIDDLYGLATIRLFRPTIMAWGTSTTLPILKKSAFERIEIPVPPMPLQNLFSARIRAVEGVCDADRQSGERLDELFLALQQRAFRGEL